MGKFLATQTGAGLDYVCEEGSRDPLDVLYGIPNSWCRHERRDTQDNKESRDGPASDTEEGGDTRREREGGYAHLLNTGTSPPCTDTCRPFSDAVM